MEKNSAHEKSQSFTGKSDSDNSYLSTNFASHNRQNENPVTKNTSSETAKNNNTGIYNKGKGTGMSDEANASQSEESWQGTGGSNANRMQQNNDEQILDSGMAKSNSLNKESVSDYDGD